MFIGRTDVEAEAPIVWPPDGKSWLIWKDPDAGKDWGQEEKGTTEDEMVGWHHRLNGHGFGWTPGVGDGQGGLACCSSWGCRVGHDWATELNWTGNKATPFLKGKPQLLFSDSEFAFWLQEISFLISHPVDNRHPVISHLHPEDACVSVSPELSSCHAEVPHLGVLFFLLGVLPY